MTMPIPPLLNQFGSTPHEVVVGFVALNRFWIVGLLQRMSERTGATEFTTYDPRARRSITLSLVANDRMSNNALALLLVLWLMRSGGEVTDEVNRFLQNLPIGLDGDASCLPALKNPHLDEVQRRAREDAGEVVGLATAAVITGFLVAGAVAIVFIGFAAMVAIIVLPGLMEIAAVELLEDDYFKAKEVGAEFSGDTETAVRGGVLLTVAGGTMIGAIAGNPLQAPDVGKLVIDTTDGGTRGGNNAEPSDAAFSPLVLVGIGLVALAVVRG